MIFSVHHQSIRQRQRQRQTPVYMQNSHILLCLVPPILAFLGPFGDPMAPSYGHFGPENAPHTLPWMCSGLLQPWSNLIQQFGAPRAGDLWPQNGHFGLFGPYRDPMAPPYGHFGPCKWFPRIVPDVTRLDPTLVHSDPAVWGSQGDLWHQKGHFGLFRPFRDPMAPPMTILDPVNGSHALTHCPGCEPPWSNLDPLCFSSLECPGWLMAIKGKFWANLDSFWP